MSDSTPPVSLYDDSRPVDVFVYERPRRRYWLPILLLAATLFTTLVVGARLEYNFLHDRPAFSLEEDAFNPFRMGWILEEPSRLLLGVPFAVTLITILLSHEMGHFLYCARYGVNATLPFFIPAPTLIGTFGAFIRIKSAIRSRAALFDIGIAGPIAGFVVATAVLVFALTLSRPAPPGASQGGVTLGYPLIFHLVHWLLVQAGVSGPGAIPLDAAYLHPTGVAAWVGMFATALNLLPGGQLDGGHIVYALSPKAHRTVSRITIFTLLPLAWLWPGWLIWAVLLGLSGMRHPQVPPWPGLDGKRKLLGGFALAMLILTFMPMPFYGAALGWPGE